MLIGINGGYFPAICRVCLVLIVAPVASLRNRSMLTTKCHQNKSDLKNVFLQTSFFRYLFFQSPSCLLESTAAIFRQSAGYVLHFFPIRIEGILLIDSKFFISFLQSESSCSILRLSRKAFGVLVNLSSGFKFFEGFQWGNAEVRCFGGVFVCASFACERLHKNESVVIFANEIQFLSLRDATAVYGLSSLSLWCVGGCIRCPRD